MQKFFLIISGFLSIQSLSDHLPVHDWDVHKQKEDDEEVVHESQKAKERFREDVERWGQVRDGTNKTEKNANPEHPEEPAHWKHLPEGVTKQGGNIAQPVHQLRVIERQKHASNLL